MGIKNGVAPLDNPVIKYNLLSIKDLQDSSVYLPLEQQESPGTPSDRYLLGLGDRR